MMIASWVAMSESCAAIKKSFPGLTVPSEVDLPEGAVVAPLALQDSSKVEALLGRKLIGLQQMMEDSVRSLIKWGHLKA